jgi:hypothetical protein
MPSKKRIWTRELDALVCISSRKKIVVYHQPKKTNYRCLARIKAESLRLNAKSKLVFVHAETLPKAIPLAIETMYQLAVEYVKELSAQDYLFFVFNASEADITSVAGESKNIFSVVRASNFGILKGVRDRFETTASHPSLQSFVAIKPHNDVSFLSSIESNMVGLSVNNAINTVRKLHPDKKEWMASVYAGVDAAEIFLKHPVFAPMPLPPALQQLITYEERKE